MNANRAYGVEVEMFSRQGVDTYAVAEAIRAAGVDCRVEGYNHTTRTWWKLVSDSSITPDNGGTGMELVSPKLYGEAGLEEIRTVCAVLERLGMRVNKTTGLHVHHDAADLATPEIKRIFKLYTKFEDVFDSLMPESRRKGNQFCLPMTTYCYAVTGGYVEKVNAAMKKIDQCHNTQDLARAYANTRYMKLNLQSYFRHGSLEFRQHSGTVEAAKIVNWVRLTQTFVEEARRLAVRTLDALSMAGLDRRFIRLFDAIHLDPQNDLRGFYRERQKHFAARAAA